MDVSGFDLNLLRVLVAIRQERSVSVAAERLDLSQPAISLALRRLRTLLGDPLFVRTKAGMMPTPHCAEIAAAAERALSIVSSDVLKVPVFNPSQSRREFRFGMNDVGEMVLLPQIITHLAASAPHCDIRCASLNAQQLLGALESGEVDLAIGWFPDLDKAGFFAQKLFTRSFVCLARADHPAIHGERIGMKTFLELSHIVVESQGRSSELFEAVLKKEGLKRRVQLSLPHFMSVPVIIAQTDLIVTVPAPVAHYFHRFDNLRVFQPPVNVRSYAIKQYWHERYQADPAVRWIRQQTAELFSGAAMSSRN